MKIKLIVVSYIVTFGISAMAIGNSCPGGINYNNIIFPSRDAAPQSAGSGSDVGSWHNYKTDRDCCVEVQANSNDACPPGQGWVNNAYRIKAGKTRGIGGLIMDGPLDYIKDYPCVTIYVGNIDPNKPCNQDDVGR